MRRGENRSAAKQQVKKLLLRTATETKSEENQGEKRKADSTYCERGRFSSKPSTKKKLALGRGKGGIHFSTKKKGGYIGGGKKKIVKSVRRTKRGA